MRAVAVFNAQSKYRQYFGRSAIMFIKLSNKLPVRDMRVGIVQHFKRQRHCILFIAIDQPKGNAKSYGYATGGWVAAPAVARTIASTVSILGMPPKADDAELSDSLKQFVAVKSHE